MIEILDGIDRTIGILPTGNVAQGAPRPDTNMFLDEVYVAA